MQETEILSLSREDSLAKDRETHSSIFAWETPWREKPGGLQSIGSQSYDQSRQHIKKQRHYFANKGPSSQGYGVSSSHIWL